MQEKQKSLKLINPFESLSNEIIFSILDFLECSPQSKKSFSLTCKSFHSIESHHRRTLKPLQSDLISRTLQRYPHVRRVDFTHCPKIEDTTLINLAITCSKTLISVNLSKSRLFTHVGLSRLAVNCASLVELDLSDAVELTDLGACAIGGAKNLEKLWLERCKLVSDVGVGFIADGCKRLKLICLKWCVRVTDLGVDSIASNCKELNWLDLSYLPITDKSLPPVFQLQHLKGLTLVGCSGIDDKSLRNLDKGCKSLEVLNVSKCRNITHNGLGSILNGTECLLQLNLAYTFPVRVPSDLTKCFQKLSKLQSIKLDGCLVTSAAMKAIGDGCESLKELSLIKCSGVTDEGLSYIVQKHVQLQKLDITCCRGVTYASLYSITTSCAHLTSLTMEGCLRVPNEAFVLIGHHCRYLEELNVTESEISDEGLEAISRLSKLLNLKVGLCMNITDHGLSRGGKRCQNITNLDLYRCIRITDLGIAAIANGCPSLETINMAYCDRVTDRSLISLSQCLKLKELGIRGCLSVTSVGLSAIAGGCKHLTTLDIKKCHSINDSGIMHLAQCSQYLKRINLSYCPVTDVGLLALASISRLQIMTILHVNGLTPDGLVASVMACRGLVKLKAHTFFKVSIPEGILGLLEERGCIFHWSNKIYPVISSFCL